MSLTSIDTDSSFAVGQPLPMRLGAQVPMQNPHFDQNRLVWDDAYSGEYQPPNYDEQFELQWHIALKGNPDYFNNPGTSTEDAYIQDRVYEWTGRHPSGQRRFSDPTMGSYVMDNPVDPALIIDKKCIDVGCGMGRWTRTMQMIGASEVLSVDISESAIASTRQFNSQVLRTNILKLPEEYPELIGQFDFANLWGVAMCTHDPKAAFASAAAMVAPGGALYLMVYAPEGIHDRPLTNIQRRRFHQLQSVEDRLAWVDKVHDRSWDSHYALKDNLLNLSRNLRGLPKGNKMGVLDMLEPFYNWVVPLAVIEGWMSENGFTQVTVLNPDQSNKAAHHVLGRKAG
jgi:SAM-dependent methyltransferase